MSKKTQRIQPGDKWSDTSAASWRDLAESAEVTGKVVGAGGVSVGVDMNGITIRNPMSDRFGLFELTEAVQWPDATRDEGSSVEPDVAWCENCKVVMLSPSLYLYGDYASNSPTIYFPLGFRTGDDIGIGIARVGSGDKILAGLNRQSSRWESMAPPLNQWRFELKDALAPGGTATAYLLKDVGGTLTPDQDIEFEVYDRFSQFRGRARNETPDPDVSGSQGVAQYFGDSRKWEIINLQKHATMIRALTDQAVADSDSTYDIDTVTIMQPTDTALFMSADGEAPTSANNNAAGELDENVTVVLAWNDDQEDWDTLTGPCPA